MSISIAIECQKKMINSVWNIGKVVYTDEEWEKQEVWGVEM